MSAARLLLSITLWKSTASESGARQSSNRANFWQIFKGGKLISQYLESKFLLFFVDLSNVKVAFLKIEVTFSKGFPEGTQRFDNLGVRSQRRTTTNT